MKTVTFSEDEITTLARSILGALESLQNGQQPDRAARDHLTTAGALVLAKLAEETK